MSQPVGDQIADQYSIKDAARVLGISENAVLQRIKRGTINARKHDGRWVVMLFSTNGDQSPTGRSDQSQPGADHEPDWSTNQEATDQQPGLLALSFHALAPIMERIEALARENGQLRERVTTVEQERDEAKRELDEAWARIDELEVGEPETHKTPSEASPNGVSASEPPHTTLDTLNHPSIFVAAWRRLRGSA